MGSTNISEVPSIDELSPYGYVPTFYICVIFVSLFGVTTALHLVEAMSFRLWWLLPTVVAAGLGEIIGWSGRLWSSQDVLQNDPYLMQTVTTILSPTPLLAANFIILGRLITLIGPHYSRLGPKAYSLIFVSADLVALTVQAVGGAQAASALGSSGTVDLDTANQGAKIMLGGILFQFCAIIVYVSLAIEFYLRYFMDRPLRPPQRESDKQECLRPLPAKIRLMTTGLAISTTFIFIRSIYRTVELQQGFNGPIETTELWFNIGDGTPIVIAMFSMNIFHPAWLLPRPSVPAPDREAQLSDKNLADSSSSLEPRD